MSEQTNERKKTYRGRKAEKLKDRKAAKKGGEEKQECKQTQMEVATKCRNHNEHAFRF
jgi:hypothetical protein